MQNPIVSAPESTPFQKTVSWLVANTNFPLSRLPTKAELMVAGTTYPSADHAPVLIAPNPLNPRRYVVLNSGPSFGAAEFRGTNALLYPRLGDHAVFHTGGREGRLVTSGYFDEGWSLKAK